MMIIDYSPGVIRTQNYHFWAEYGEVCSNCT